LPIVALVGHYPTNEANRAQAHLVASITRLCLFPNVCGIVGDFSPVFLTSRQIPTCSSPVRHSPSGCSHVAFDLHVLGTPPAFILSQDQTRHSMFYMTHPLWDVIKCIALRDPSCIICLACSQIFFSLNNQKEAQLTGTAAHTL